MKKDSHSKKMQELIDREKESYKTPSICEFCETPYNESKTDDCFNCECMREGRAYATMPTIRESIKDTKQSLRDVGLSERKKDMESIHNWETLIRGKK
tara:strand:+ start:426 stop:719 length:294 start_codon:yes stop_codon:yes gene_type:complete